MMRKSKPKNLRDHAEDWATELADKVSPRVDNARAKAAPYLADARAKAGPMVADARDKAGPVLDDAKHRLATEVLPVLAAAMAAADEATEDVRSEGKKRSKAAMAALRGDVEPPKKKRHPIRKALLFLGLGAIIAAVVKKMSDRPATSDWQSSYSPPPSSGGTAGAHRAEEEADDQGGSSPDVVAADNAAEPHAATTPDNPAETVDVSKK